MMHRRLLFGVLAMAVGVVALAFGWVAPAGGETAPVAATVSMKDFTFQPATVRIAAGSAVRWTYDESASDPMPNCESPQFRPPSPAACPGHSTTAVSQGADGKPLWDSGVHRADGYPFTHTFTAPGTYHYICTVHGGKNANNPVTHMEGDVVVLAVSGPISTAGGLPWSFPPCGGGAGGRPAATRVRKRLAARGVHGP